MEVKYPKTETKLNKNVQAILVEWKIDSWVERDHRRNLQNRKKNVKIQRESVNEIPWRGLYQMLNKFYEYI